MAARRKLSLVVVFALVLVAGFVSIRPASACYQGCTPGFWKQPQHFQDWPTFVCTDDWDDGWMWQWRDGGPDTCPLGDRIPLASPPQSTLVTAVFDVACLETGGKLDLNGDGVADTLLDALNYQGGAGLNGKARNLLRVATGDVLNAMAMDHDAPLHTMLHVQESVALGCAGDTSQMVYWATFYSDRMSWQPCPLDDTADEWPIP